MGGRYIGIYVPVPIEKQRYFLWSRCIGIVKYASFRPIHWTASLSPSAYLPFWIVAPQNSCSMLWDSWPVSDCYLSWALRTERSENLPLALLTPLTSLPLKEVSQIPNQIADSGSDCITVRVVCMFVEALVETLFDSTVLYLRPNWPLLLLPSSLLRSDLAIHVACFYLLVGPHLYLLWHVAKYLASSQSTLQSTLKLF